jgi:spoIIIJ-associated protein
MRTLEVVARSQEQAIRKAAAQLEVSPEELTVIEEYEPDALDLERLAEEEKDLPEAEKQGEAVLYVVEAGTGQILAAAAEWLNGLVDRFQPGSSVEVQVEQGEIVAFIDAPEPPIFIGRQGQTLEALQHVVSRVMPQLIEGCPPVKLEVGDYREKREEQLGRMATNAADKALRTRRAVALPTMSAHDRKLIHNILKNYAGVVTSSHGREPERYVVVEAEGAAGNAIPQAPDVRRSGRGGGNSGGGRGRGGRSGSKGNSRGGRRDLYGEQPAIQVERPETQTTSSARPTSRSLPRACRSTRSGPRTILCSTPPGPSSTNWSNPLFLSIDGRVVRFSVHQSPIFQDKGYHTLCTAASTRTSRKPLGTRL